jgi:hypothetical protein
MQKSLNYFGYILAMGLVFIFKLLQQNFPGETEENHEVHESRQALFSG